jgi:hypothetical protein
MSKPAGGGASMPSSAALRLSCDSRPLSEERRAEAARGSTELGRDGVGGTQWQFRVAASSVGESVGFDGGVSGGGELAWQAEAVAVK